MDYREHDFEDLQLLHLATPFDFSTVELMTGFDREHVMSSILNYENISCEHGLLGYIDVSDVLADVFENFIMMDGQSRTDINGSNFYPPDYMTELYLMTDAQEIDIDEDAHEDIGGFSQYLTKLYTILTIGILFPMDQEQREFWAGAVARIHDIDEHVHPDDVVRFVGDNVVFQCFVPKEVDEDEPNGIHSDIISRVLQQLSDNAPRHRPLPSNFAA